MKEFEYNQQHTCRYCKFWRQQGRGGLCLISITNVLTEEEIPRLLKTFSTDSCLKFQAAPAQSKATQEVS